MSRKKSSRKQGSAPTAKPKLSKKELENVEKRVRKKTGKPAGNRQMEAIQKTDSKTQQGKKDPRLGNKTPIVLGAIAKKEEKKQTKAPKTASPIAAIRVVDTVELDEGISLQNELAAIEADQQLQSILAKIDEDAALTEQEVYYYNEKMDRHQTITEELGLDEEEETSAPTKTQKSEDDLWDKLDNQDFSNYE